MNKFTYFKHLVRIAQIAEELDKVNPEASEILDEALGEANPESFPPVETPAAETPVVETEPELEPKENDQISTLSPLDQSRLQEDIDLAQTLADFIMDLPEFKDLTSGEITSGDLDDIETLIEKTIDEKVNGN